MNAKRWTAAIGLLFLFHTSEAFADTPAEAEAKVRFEEGNVLWAHNKYEEARLKYVQAYAVLRFPGVIFNLGRAEMTVGHNEQAYVLFRDYLKLPQTDLERSLTAKKYVAELSKKVSFLSVSAATPAGTKVLVDGRVAGETPLTDPIVVTPGNHDVVLKYADREKKTPVSCPLQETVTVELLPEAKALGGPLPPPIERTEKSSWVVPAVLAGVGVIGLGVGFGLGAAASSEKDSVLTKAAQAPCVDRTSPSCETLRDTKSSANGLSTGAVVGYVGGSAFVLGAIISAIVLRPWAEHSVAQVQILPTVGTGQAGLLIQGSFK